MSAGRHRFGGHEPDNYAMNERIAREGSKAPNLEPHQFGGFEHDNYAIHERIARDLGRKLPAKKDK